MRTKLTLVATALAVVTACSVKNFEAPPVAGPSSFAKDLYLTATPDILTQNGVDQAQVSVNAKGPNGSPVAGLQLRAEIRVNGTVQDFGSLSSKLRATDANGAATFVYTAPPASSLGIAPAAQTVTIAVTPVGSDSGTEAPRLVDITLVPQGVIGPNNPTLIALFTVTPASPQAFSTAFFDASTTTNQGSPCGASCTYAWDFGDGSTASGIKVTHDYRTAGSKTVRLVVTDSVGAQAFAVQTITVAPSTPPTAAFVTSPTAIGVGEDVFFDATSSKPAAGRTIVSYSWNFGDGTTGSGVTTTHRYTQAGAFNVVLTVTDDANSTATATAGLTIISGKPVPALTVLPSTSLKVGQTGSFDASGSTSQTSTIVSYRFNWGDGSPEETSGVGLQTHTYGAPGSVTVTVTVTDAVGRSASKQLAITITP